MTYVHDSAADADCSDASVQAWLEPHRDVDVPLDQDVEDREGDVSHKLPDLPSQQHPQDPVRSVDRDPAPAHGHLWCVIADLVQGHGCNGDDQRNAPAGWKHKVLEGMNTTSLKVKISIFEHLHMQIFGGPYTHKHCKRHVTLWQIILCLGLLHNTGCRVWYKNKLNSRL